MHVTVTDLTTGHSGTIVLDSAKNGPLLPTYSVQKIGNALGWGASQRRAECARLGDRPHRQLHDACRPVLHSAQRHKASLLFVQRTELVDVRAAPQIKGVTFGEGSMAKSWSTVTDTGGEAEVLGDSFVRPTTCSDYGGLFGTYPWYAWNGSLNAFTFGGDYLGTTNDFGQVAQFDQTQNCASPADGGPTVLLDRLEIDATNRAAGHATSMWPRRPVHGSS